MGAAGLILGLLSGLAALFTCLSRGKRLDHDDTLLCFALAWLWAGAMAAQLLTVDMQAMEGRVARFEIGAVLDLLMGMMIVSRIRRRPAAWKWSMAALNGVALIVDILFLLSDRTRETGNACKFALNGIFIALLACGCWPGAFDVVRHYRLRVLRGLYPRSAERHGTGR